MLALAACGDPTVNKPSPERLTVKVLISGDQFGIANLDDFDWTECKFEINPKGAFGEGYSFSTTGIKAHSTGLVDAARFTDDDGLRFDPTTHAVKEFVAICGTPHGKLVQVTYPAIVQN
jgi:hypothetical protein